MWHLTPSKFPRLAAPLTSVFLSASAFKGLKGWGLIRHHHTFDFFRHPGHASEGRNLTIDLSAVTDLHDDDRKLLAVDFVNHAVIAHADSEVGFEVNCKQLAVIVVK